MQFLHYRHPWRSMQRPSLYRDAFAASCSPMASTGSRAQNEAMPKFASLLICSVIPAFSALRFAIFRYFAKFIEHTLVYLS